MSWLRRFQTFFRSESNQNGLRPSPNNKKSVNLYKFPVKKGKKFDFPAKNVILVDYVQRADGKIYRLETRVDEDYLRYLEESNQLIYDGCIYMNRDKTYYFQLLPAPDV